MNKTIEEFMLLAHQQGISLWLDQEGGLRFKAPHGAMTPAFKEQLKMRKSDIVYFLRQSQSSAPLPQMINEPEERHAFFPLTDIQEAYWIGRDKRFNLHASTHFYDEYACQDIDIQRLQQSWQALVVRHEMLRAIVHNGQQRILDDTPDYSIVCYDLSQADAATVSKHLDTVRSEMFGKLEPASRWPLFELRLTRLPTQELRIHLFLDMLIADWGSYNIIMREWAQLYDRQVLPPIAISFRDYVLAEQKIKDSKLYQQAKEYWQERLPTLPDAPDLPLAVDANSIKTPVFERYQTRLGAAQWTLLKNHASALGLTPTCLLLTAFTEVLARWSKCPRFTLNLTLFNRLSLADMAQINALVGDFTSLTMLAVDHSRGDETLESKGKRLQQQLWQDLDNRHYSGVEVLRALAAKQHDSNAALMPVVFTSGIGLPEEPYRPLGQCVYGRSQTPQVWLDCQVQERDGQVDIDWDVVEALFPTGLISDMFAAYTGLLNRLSADATICQRCGFDMFESLILPHKTVQNALHETMQPNMLHTLFIKQATVNPEHIAVIAPDRSLTYQQLYHESALLALHLHDCGVQSDQLVAVVMSKGWEQVVAVMGILMAGAAYLPVEPSLPTERLHYLLKQSEATIALTHKRVADKLDFPNDVQCFCVAEHHHEVNEQTLHELLEPLLAQQHPSNLAYVIFTSGSTGQPKGVMIDHRGAVNTILDINQRFNVTANDTVLALSALNFDLSVYDIFGLLATGGSIVVPAPKGLRDPAYWVTLLREHRVTLWNTVPALMQMLVESRAGHALASAPQEENTLRLVMMSGDWIPLGLPEQIRAIIPHADLISLGGATEASIWSIYYPIKEVLPTWKSIPYGKPLLNQNFYVLNQCLEVCPVWLEGHLYIAGAGLALGYWRDEEKTNASFFTHPHTGERLYKTGDLGRYLPDGNIEFLGRDDFQVKIRGFRIELGEIEAHLAKHERVNKTVVTATGDGRQKQLVAYIVANEASDEHALSPQHAMDQAVYFDVMQGVVSDPVERLQFKLKQTGVLSVDGEPSYTSHHITLPCVNVNDSAYLERQTYRQFQAEPIDLLQLSSVLSCLQSRNFEATLLPKYQYASAGSLYPIQSYVYIKSGRITSAGGAVAGGFYYHHPKEHRLICVSMDANDGMHQALHGGTNKIIFSQSAFTIFLVADYRAIEPMYGSCARDFCLLEAGYMSQLLMMKAASYNVGLCTIGGMNFDPLRSFFALDDQQEMVHSFLGGGIDALQKTTIHVGEVKAEPLDECLSNHLQKKLPDYMITHHFVELPSLPLTSNGKIDRQALPHPDSVKKQQMSDSSHHSTPSNPLEHRLLELVKQVLECDDMGMQDDFIALGANSLDLVLLHDKIETSFQCTLEMADIFHYTCVQKLAELVAENTNTVDEDVTATAIADVSHLTPESIDSLAANIDNLSDAEVEQLLQSSLMNEQG